MTAEGSQAVCQFMAMEGATFVLLATSVISEANREKAGYPNAPYAKVVRQCPQSLEYINPHSTPYVQPFVLPADTTSSPAAATPKVSALMNFR